MSFQWSAWQITDTRPLAILPIWPGLAINTVFYAALLWIVTLGPGTARRFIRDKPGLCIKSGYDLRGGEAKGGREC